MTTKQQPDGECLEANVDRGLEWKGASQTVVQRKMRRPQLLKEERRTDYHGMLSVNFFVTQRTWGRGQRRGVVSGLIAGKMSNAMEQHKSKCE
jgi:hypothetical protein